MTIKEWLASATNTLNIAGISTSRLDCLVLLEDETGKDRAWLLSHPEYDLQIEQFEKLNTKIVQRTQHVPLAYIRGKAEFYGREFIINEHTLVPRPETETMIEMLKRVRNLEADIAASQVERRGRKPIKKRYAFEKPAPKSSLVKTTEGYKVVWQKPLHSQLTQAPASIHGQSLKYHDEDLSIIDIGTGSGAIAITAKLEISDATVIATDIDEACLKTARANAQNLGAIIQFLPGNLLKPLLQEPGLQHGWFLQHIVLANLPYVPDNFHINTAATHEPRQAIFGGADGLDLYRNLFQQVQLGNLKPTYIITESLPTQHEALAAIAKTAGYNLSRSDDFIQLFDR